MTDRERFRRLQELFALASARPAAERARLLQRECDGDPELRREVDELLRHHDARDGAADPLLRAGRDLRRTLRQLRRRPDR